MKKLRHQFEYIIFILITKLLGFIGIDKSASFCAYIAKKIGPHLKVSNIARNNLKHAYGKNKNENNKIINDLWDNYGRYIGEFPFINKLTNKELKERVDIQNIELLQKFKDNKQPFLLFLAHQANWDILIRRINDLYPKFAIIYRKANNPYIDKKILSERGNAENLIMIEKGTKGSRNLIKALKSGYSIAMLVDQKMNDGIEVPFFDQPAMTAHAIAKLSIQYNLPIIPLQISRIDKSSYFKLMVHKPVKYKTTGDNTQDCYDIMLKINKILEGWIRKKPAEWFWFHNRWKK